MKKKYILGLMGAVSLLQGAQEPSKHQNEQAFGIAGLTLLEHLEDYFQKAGPDKGKICGLRNRSKKKTYCIMPVPGVPEIRSELISLMARHIQQEVPELYRSIVDLAPVNFPVADLSEQKDGSKLVG